MKLLKFKAGIGMITKLDATTQPCRINVKMAVHFELLLVDWIRFSFLWGGTKPASRRGKRKDETLMQQDPFQEHFQLNLAI